MGPGEAGTHLAPANADNTEVLSLDYELFAGGWGGWGGAFCFAHHSAPRT